MTEKCRIFNTIEHIKAAAYCNIVYMGGSLTSAAGVGNSAATSWRRLFTRYIYECYHRLYHCQPSEVMAAIGAMESYGAVFTIERNVRPNLPVLAFVEFCVNDSASPDKNLVKKGIEGIIRQLKTCATRPDIVLLGAGHRPASSDNPVSVIDHSIHREIAEHYGLAFIDVHDYMLKTLDSRGQTWDDISIVFEKNDPCHLNDYGNLIWFECLRDWFQQQWHLYDLDPTKKPDSKLPEPFYSGQFQYTKLINPSKKNKQIQLDGNWGKKDNALVPWYMDDLLVGRPGDRLTFSFKGTAVGAICLVNCNGLKIEAKIDGREITGPYTNFAVEFGKFFMMEHNMENTEHILQLQVGQPMKKRNKLEDPTSQIGYLAVAASQ